MPELQPMTALVAMRLAGKCSVANLALALGISQSELLDRESGRIVLTPDESRRHQETLMRLLLEDAFKIVDARIARENARIKMWNDRQAAKRKARKQTEGGPR